MTLIKKYFGVIVFVVLATLSKSAMAADPLPVDTGDTAWVLICIGLVLFMTPGLAFFYGGLVRRKNMLSILMQCFTLMCLITIQWVVVGYSLSFGPDIKGWIGSLAWVGLQGVGLTPYADYSATIPHQAFMIYQAMFAIITPGLILGAFAERMKFAAFCVFSLLWATLVYDPVCHWVWAVGGFLRTMGALDFAGGTVVHINAGIAALVSALVLGRRKGYPTHMSPPHNLPLAVLGAGILWLGWFGFNGGSALGAGSLAVNAVVVSHVAASAAGLTWSLLDWKFNSKPTMLGMITGAVAGLVAITPAAGFVGVIDSIWIGIGVSLICYFFVTVIKPKMGYDDSLDAFGVHGVGGIWGALATGLWANKEINPAGANGLFYGNPGQLIIQLKATVITIVYSFVVSWILFKVVDLIFGLRASNDEERIGLDLTQHRETAYTMLD
jgi:ammonium transporter, Amt family